MKKKLFIVSALLMALFIQAGNHKLVVRGSSVKPGGATKVSVEPIGDTDSIIITPAANVSDIQVRVSHVNGTVISQISLPANEDNSIDIITPEYPEGCLLEIEDNNGVVYSEME